jgi:hypothetical protein
MAVLSTLAPIVTGIGSAVAAALADTPDGTPERVCLLVPGDIAADGCDCGQLALTIQRRYGSYTFPAEATTDEAAAECPPPVLVGVVTLTLFRCVPSPDDQGNPPSCDALQDAAVGQDVDIATIRRTLACHLANLATQEQILHYTVGATVSNGPSGGCGGSDTTITIGIPNCGCG